MTVICPECGRENTNDSQSCFHCGYPFSEATSCPDCARLNTKDSASCYYCGCPLTAENKKPKIKIKTLLPIIISVAVVITTVVGIAVGVTKNKNDFKEKLVQGGVWFEAETNNKVRFDEDGKMLYINLNWYGLDEGLEYSIAACEYKVKTGNRIEIDGTTVKVEFKSNGEITFEPDIEQLVHQASKKASKGE